MRYRRLKGLSAFMRKLFHAKRNEQVGPTSQPDTLQQVLPAGVTVGWWPTVAAVLWPQRASHNFTRHCPGEGCEKMREKNVKQFLSSFLVHVVVNM